MAQQKLEAETACVQLKTREGIEGSRIRGEGTQVADDRGHRLEQTVSKGKTHR
jgi:hypothetical protein